MKKILIGVLALFFVKASFAVESSAGASVFSKNQKFDHEGVELYDSNLDMKSMKRLGAGFVAGGLTGLAGINIEYNLRPEDVAYFGLGTGTGFNSFNFGYKRNFEGYYMSPYTKVGFSRWSNSANGSSGSAKKSDILRQVLSDNDINENSYAVNFLTGSAGLEYNQLEGNLSGVNLFGELQAMYEFSSAKLIPTGAVGITYFY